MKMVMTESLLCKGKNGITVTIGTYKIEKV